MSDPERLEVHLGGELLATLEDRGMGFVALTFSEQAFKRYGVGARVLSLSLPIAQDVPAEGATQFLRGLLPEGPALERVAQQLRLSTNDTFGLLRELGRDSAGALVIVPAGTPLGGRDEVDWLDDHALADWIRALPDNPLGLDPTGEVRLSLAGVQDKLVVSVQPESGVIGRPLHGTPSTHILKPPSLAVDGYGRPRTPAIVENEAFCMRLAQAAGLSVASSEVRFVEGRPTLLVARYDRRTQDGRIERIHQEDACQALGIDPLHKYEESGGPSLEAISRVIREFSAEPLRDIYRLLDMTALNLVVGNLDAHGKNFSFLLHADGSVVLAPGYDIVSVTAYPVFADGTLAMRIGQARRPQEADGRSLVAAYVACGLTERVANRRIPELIDAIEQSFATVLETARDEGWHTSILDGIVAASQARIEQVRA